MGDPKRQMLFVLPCLAALMLTACVAPIGNGISSAGGEVSQNATLAFLPSNDPQSAVQTRVQTAVGQALIRLGYKVGASGDYIVDTALSERPLSVSFETDGSLHSSTTRARNIGLCAQRIQRLTVAVVDQRSGRSVYQGQSEVTHCAGTIDDHAVTLANAAVANMRTTTLIR